MSEASFMPPNILQEHFMAFLMAHDNALAESYARALNTPECVSPSEESMLILELAPYVEDFMGEVFSIKDALYALQRAHHAYDVIYRVKRDFVQRSALKKYTLADLGDYVPDLFQGNGENFDLTYAALVDQWLCDETAYADDLKKAALYAVWVVHTEKGARHHRTIHKNSVIFHLPQKIDFNSLVKVPSTPIMNRDGFALTDAGLNLKQSLGEAHYCIHCHKQNKDACSKGYRDKKAPEVNLKNPLNVPLDGCPLDQKISEMNLLKSRGYSLGALATAMIDNPLLAATGHRICNDCSRACIYQKQSPVTIPGMETEILKSVLNLPHGVAIYDMLTRWNPLNIRRPYPKPATGRKILVVGSGPAGFSLSYHLLQEGHTVVLIDGAKIIPWNNHTPSSWIDFCEDLDTRKIQGFGGVMEYGITVRWNKNYLKLIRLVLERHERFLLMGGVRFGGAITSHQAFDELNFDHIALCMGAGKPHLLTMKNSLAKGVRYASDFLMDLQLTGTYQKDNPASMTMELPVIVIGGGLTSMDTATEALAYYPRFVAKKAAQDKNSPYAAHHGLFENERAQAKAENRPVNFLPILNDLGGVTLLYRKDITQSPAYRMNHEEVQQAMDLGVRIVGDMTPIEIDVDDDNHVTGIVVRDTVGNETMLPCRTLLIATGTNPNTNILHDEPDLALVESNAFKLEESDGFVIHRRPDNKAMTMFGDMHPHYAGNVVKAMASAKQGYPVISKMLQDLPSCKNMTANFLASIKEQLTAMVVIVNRLTPTVLEVVVKAPLPAKALKPGQFFRVQNFSDDPATTMEPMALTGCDVDPVAGTISLIVFEGGWSQKLCQHFKVGEPIVLMGPTGSPSHIPKGQNILLMGGGVGNAILFPILKAMKEAGNTVIYIAGYKKKDDLFKREVLEAHANHIIWCCDEGKIPTMRPTDYTVHGGMIEALQAYAAQTMVLPVHLASIHHSLIIGSSGLMGAVAHAFKTTLKLYLNPNATHQAGVNSPMQCMMKGVCAQCLQRHVNPLTEEETIVFSCVNQDQNMLTVDFECLNIRLRENG